MSQRKEKHSTDEIEFITTEYDDPKIQEVLQQVALNILNAYKGKLLVWRTLNDYLTAISENVSKANTSLESITSELDSIAHIQDAMSILIGIINVEVNNANTLMKSKNIDHNLLQSSLEIIDSKLALLTKIREKQNKKNLDVMPDDAELKKHLGVLLKLIGETQEYLDKEFIYGEQNKLDLQCILVCHADSFQTACLKVKEVVDRISQLRTVQNDFDSTKIQNCKDVAAEFHSASSSSSHKAPVAVYEHMKMFTPTAALDDQNKPLRKTPPIVPKASTLQPRPAVIYAKDKTGVVNHGAFAETNNKSKEQVKPHKDEKKAKEVAKKFNF